MSQLKIDKLTVAYDGKTVLKDISFEVESGEYIAVVGENGSGKSTLMKCILGLIKARSGSVSFSDNVGAGSIGYLPQQSTAQRDFPSSVEEVVLSAFSGKKKLPFYSKCEKQKVCESLKTLGIENLLNCSYSELSGGQQQRVLLSRALCAADGMLLLDEPVNGLDPTATAEMYEVISNLNKQGITVIMILHDVSSAMIYADKILHLAHDKFFFGTADEYHSSQYYDCQCKKGGAK